MNSPGIGPHDLCADAGTHIPRSPQAELHEAITSLSMMATLLANRRVSISSALLSAFPEDGSQKRNLKRAIHTVLAALRENPICAECAETLAEQEVQQ